MRLTTLLVLLVLACGSESMPGDDEASSGGSGGDGGGDDEAFSGRGGGDDEAFSGRGGESGGSGGSVSSAGGSGGRPPEPARWEGECDPADPNACGGRGCHFTCEAGARCSGLGSDTQTCPLFPCGTVTVEDLSQGTPGRTYTRLIDCPAATVCLPARMEVVAFIGSHERQRGSSVCLAACVRDPVVDTGGRCAPELLPCSSKAPAGGGYYRPIPVVSRDGACPIPAHR